MTTDKTDSAELKACPFCGKQPVFGLTKKTGCQMHGDPIQYVTLSCTCQHHPFVTGGDRYSNGESGRFFIEGEKRAKELAIKYWNHRAAVSRAPSDDAAEGNLVDVEDTVSLCRGDALLLASYFKTREKPNVLERGFLKLIEKKLRIIPPTEGEKK